MKTRRTFLGTLGAAALFALVSTGVSFTSWAQGPVTNAAPGPGEKWAATWATSIQGTFGGNAGVNFAIPSPTTEGANEQTMRMMIKPDLWGRVMRFRFSNFFGTQPVTFGRATVGLQTYGANVRKGTLVPLSFNGGASSVTIPAGEIIYSDGVLLPFVAGPDDPAVLGARLAVSFYIQGSSGPISLHNSAFNTSYLSGRSTGDRTQEENDASYPYTVNSWFYIDCADVAAPTDTAVICCFGDSITDGLFAVQNGDDRWPNDLSRRLRARYGFRTSVVNEGISGNRVVPPGGAGPAATLRVDRDVLGLSGLTDVIWLEGINDLSSGNTAENVIAGYQEIIDKLRARGITIVGATVMSFNNPNLTGDALATSQIRDAKRRVLNDFIRTPGNFDSIADFDAVIDDPATGTFFLKYAAQSSVTNPDPDYLHPGRAGFQAMAFTIDLGVLAPAGAQ